MTEALKKINVVVIVGPTASGKTDLAVNIAKHFNGEIVSADSMQIYEKMDIATAKPSPDEQQGIVHHLLGFLDPAESFSVAQFCDKAHKTINDISARGKLAIVAGGTGLYIDSLINNISFSNADCDQKLRDELHSLYEQHGVDHLLSMLNEFDPQSAARLSEQKNVKRIIRAIEIYKLTGITQTRHNINSTINPSPYNAVKIGLKADDRQFLYDRINTRVDDMLSRGLLTEAEEFLLSNVGKTSSMAIGYKELLPYFDGIKSLDECVENLKMQTRRYAKRQLTWFLRDDKINWFNIDQMTKEDILKESVLLIKKEFFNET